MHVLCFFLSSSCSSASLVRHGAIKQVDCKWCGRHQIIAPGPWAHWLTGPWAHWPWISAYFRLDAGCWTGSSLLVAGCWPGIWQGREQIDAERRKHAQIEASQISRLDSEFSGQHPKLIHQLQAQPSPNKNETSVQVPCKENLSSNCDVAP